MVWLEVSIYFCFKRCQNLALKLVYVLGGVTSMVVVSWGNMHHPPASLAYDAYYLHLLLFQERIIPKSSPSLSFLGIAWKISSLKQIIKSTRTEIIQSITQLVWTHTNFPTSAQGDLCHITLFSRI